MRARKGGEAKRRRSPHAGAHAREYACISVYLMERGPDTFSLGGVVRGAVCGLDLEAFIHIFDTNGGVEDQRRSLFSPRVTLKRKVEGGSACEREGKRRGALKPLQSACARKQRAEANRRSTHVPDGES